MATLNLGFFASHGGSNFQAIVNNIKNKQLDANAKLLICNNSNAKVLERAKYLNVPSIVLNESQFDTKEDYNLKLISTLKKHNVDTIVLAGYMKMIPAELIDAFNGRVLNIHPALLPKFGGKGMFGMNVHKAVIEAGEKWTGVTIHQVNKEYDKGKILAQEKVKVQPDDTAETLSEKVLKVEHKLYSEVLNKIADGKIKI